MAAALLAGVLGLVGACARVPPDPSPRWTPAVGVETAVAPTPAVTSAGVGASLRMVSSEVISGFDLSVDEHLQSGRHSYVALPRIAGLEAWTQRMRDDRADQVDRFLHSSVTGESDRELIVSWDVVAASPEVVGFRLSTAEMGEGRYLGTAETTWYDLSTRTVRAAEDLLAPEARQAALDRLGAAAQAEPLVVGERLLGQLDRGLGGFRSIAFTPSGALWFEFDRARLFDVMDPLGVAIDPTGLLSAFGENARRAALQPRDPGPLRASPSASTSRAPTPRPSGTPKPPDARPAPPVKVNCAKRKCVALTFDDGPVSETSQLLDLLADKGVRATFFTIGSHVQSHPEIIRRMVADGHVVGNHSLKHPDLTRLAAPAIRKELATTTDLIRRAAGIRPTLMRPPFGSTNRTVGAVAHELGLAQVLWSVDPLDWKDRDADVVARRVLSQARPGSIILSHDIHATTRRAYRRIIDGLRAKGFVLVTVPQLFGRKLAPGAIYSHR